MKKLTKNLSFVVVSLFLITIIFGSGFYVGNNMEEKNHANASELADLSSFWRVWNLLDEKYVAASSTKSISDEDKIYGAIQGMVSALGDPYTVFLPPQENEAFNENLEGNFSGVGMEVGMRDELIVVISPLKDSPAEKAGLLPGDVILQIESTNVAGISLDDAVKLIRGDKGTSVQIIVAREGESEPLTFKVTRDLIKIPNIKSELRSDGVFVITLYNFNAEATSAFRQALREFLLAKTDKLILDLRGNPGGFLDAAVDITSWFLPAGKTVVIEDFGGGKEQKVFRSKGFNLFNNNLKMAILVNKGSASASEIVAGALSAHGIADLVGENTFGKGSVQELVNVTDNTALKVTVARWLTPEGLSISDGGLKPDYEVGLTREDIEAGNDPQLEKAAQLLLEK